MEKMFGVREILNLAQAELRAMYNRLSINGSNVLDLIDKELKPVFDMEIVDYKGDPYLLIGKMSDKGEIIGFDKEYDCWTISKYGQVGRTRQNQKPYKRQIVYPKISRHVQ